MSWSESWIALLGASLLLLAGWSWRGRSGAARWWIRVWQGDTMALGFAPGLGLVFLGLGIIALVPDDPAQTPAGMIASLVWLAGLVVFAVGSWGPRWWGPRWFRSMSDRDRVAALRGPAGAAARARTGHPDGYGGRDTKRPGGGSGG